MVHRLMTLLLPFCLCLAPAAHAADTSGGAAPPPRPEHPRPDAQRADWLCLNGPWQFEIDQAGDGEQRGLTTGKDLHQRIVVPFAPESKLSGLAHTALMKNVWYRREFELPPALQGRRLLLHLGAIDYRARVWVNGQLVGQHTGGSAPLDCEITAALRAGRNEVVVHAFDDTASGLQPTGKQAHTVSEGCVYTRTTGIWQTVWLEAVGETYVKEFSLAPDLEHARVVIEAEIDGPLAGLELTATAFAGGKKVGEESGPAVRKGGRLVLALSEQHPWAPGSPFLYDLTLTLRRGDHVVDTVQGYFGLRTISLDGRAFLINGQRIFQRLILDQGFYPDGIWTAPSDAALKRDIELAMAAGYNGARLHQKVFEPRYLYWADRLGYLVWGEFPSWGYNYEAPGHAPYVAEWTEVLRRDRNHPALIGWCPFNETNAAAAELQQVIWAQTRAVDPTRPVLETSGFTFSLPSGELRDAHDYEQDPARFRQRWRDFFSTATLQLPARYGGAPGDLGLPFMLSEFGGTSWVEENDRGAGWGYGSAPTHLEDFYQRYTGLVDALLDNPNLFGFCYTQLTDVEQERNGLYYYDRRPKFDLRKLHAITTRQAAYERCEPQAPPPAPRAELPWRVLVGAQPDGELARPYHYTTTAPAADWAAPAFAATDWASGLAPFGQGLPGTRTPWNTPDIYLRQSFDCDEDASPTQLALVVFHDEGTEVFLNGERIWRATGYLNGYRMVELPRAAAAHLRPGHNTLAVHTHQSGGGQFIDLALLAR